MYANALRWPPLCNKTSVTNYWLRHVLLVPHEMIMHERVEHCVWERSQRWYIVSGAFRESEMRPLWKLVCGVEL